MKILVTGSRNCPPHKAHIVWETLRDVADMSETHELFHGECPYGGVDLVAASWAHGAGWKVTPFPPDPAYGNRGFYLRNQAMVDRVPDIVLAFPLKRAANNGTRMTMKLAKQAGLTVEETWL